MLHAEDLVRNQAAIQVHVAESVDVPAEVVAVQVLLHLCVLLHVFELRVVLEVRKGVHLLHERTVPSVRSAEGIGADRALGDDIVCLGPLVVVAPRCSKYFVP